MQLESLQLLSLLFYPSHSDRVISYSPYSDHSKPVFIVSHKDVAMSGILEVYPPTTVRR